MMGLLGCHLIMSQGTSLLVLHLDFRTLTQTYTAVIAEDHRGAFSYEGDIFLHRLPTPSDSRTDKRVHYSA